MYWVFCYRGAQSIVFSFKTKKPGATYNGDEVCQPLKNIFCYRGPHKKCLLRTNNASGNRKNLTLRYLALF